MGQMTARELARSFYDYLRDHEYCDADLNIPVIYIDESSGAEIDIEAVIYEDGKLKLISHYTKGESEL